MKKSVLIRIVTVIVVSLTLVLIYHLVININESDNSQIAVRVISQAEVDVVIKKQRAEINKQKAYIQKIHRDKGFAESELRRIATENPRAKRMIQVVKAANLPIEFYGVLVDKENNPISGADIKYSIGPAFGIGQPLHGKVMSDGNGHFIIKSEGSIVSILSVVKSGYQFPDGRYHFFSATESGRPNTWRDHGKSNPFKILGDVKK